MIIELQRRLAEIGRIRIGQQVPSGKGTRPTKLDTFRLTSADRNRINQAAVLYGGTPTEWEAPAGPQWEIITDTDALNVIVPPSDMSFSQHYELWAGGGCQRRCDGVNESLSEGGCLCDPDKRECSIHTRLSVMLRDLPGLGVWRIDTSGYYAAVELQGAVEVVQMAAGRGQMLPARLRLEQRRIKRQGQSVKRFAVPVLDIEVSPAQLLGGGAMAMLGDGTPGTIAIEAPRGPVDGARSLDQATTPPTSPLRPVPQTVPETPIAPVAEQATATKERKPRKNAAQPVPRTGIKPRTAAQASERTSDSGPKPETSQVDETPVPDGPSTGAQNKAINQLFIDAGVEDKQAKRDVIVSLIGYEVKALTEAEAAKIIARLDDWKSAGKLTDEVWAIVDPVDPEPESAQPPSQLDLTEPITDPQKTKLAIIREERYAKTIKGRGQWFTWVNAQLHREADREVSSNTELTKVEAMKLLDLLEPERNEEEPPTTDEGN